MQAAPEKTRITIASGVRVRTAPQVAATEVAKLPIGTVVQELEQSVNKEKISQVEDYWYRVALQDGKEGWIFGGLLTSFEPSKRGEIYRRIVTERLKLEETNFAEQVDLVNFLTRVLTEVTDPSLLAELELAQLLALQRAAASIPFGQQAQRPYQAWLKSQEGKIFYNEVGGNWLVDSNLFWELQRKYSSLPIADQIAWESAQAPLGGECEGYLPCSLQALGSTEGRYLKLYPQGVHAEEALDHIAEILAWILDTLKTQKLNEIHPDDRAELSKNLTELRITITKTSGPKKEEMLNQLDQIIQYYHLK